MTDCVPTGMLTNLLRKDCVNIPIQSSVKVKDVFPSSGVKVKLFYLHIFFKLRTIHLWACGSVSTFTQ